VETADMAINALSDLYGGDNLPIFKGSETIPPTDQKYKLVRASGDRNKITKLLSWDDDDDKAEFDISTSIHYGNNYRLDITLDGSSSRIFVDKEILEHDPDALYFLIISKIFKVPIAFVLM
jgi:hypothetical protein